MKYLSFENLTIELSRRCNMKPRCKHCIQGASQNIDLDRTDIDNLLNQTELIGDLALLGGEPLVRIDTVQYLLEAVKERAIPIFGLTIVTNGLTEVERVANIIKPWSDYILECNRKYKGTKERGSAFTTIKISRDKYHAHGRFVDLQIDRYTELLSDFAKVEISAIGEIPVLMGSAAKNLRDGEGRVPNLLEAVAHRQISIIDENHKMPCQRFRSIRLFYSKQVLICCGLYLTARGTIVPDSIAYSFDFETVDMPCNIICHADDNVYEKIIEFNSGKMDCFEYALWLQKNTPPQNQALDLKYILSHMGDVMSWYRVELSQRQNAGHALTFAERRAISDPQQSQGVYDRLRREALNRDYLSRTCVCTSEEERLDQARQQTAADMVAIREIWKTQNEKENR